MAACWSPVMNQYLKLSFQSFDQVFRERIKTCEYNVVSRLFWQAVRVYGIGFVLPARGGIKKLNKGEGGMISRRMIPDKRISSVKRSPISVENVILPKLRMDISVSIRHRHVIKLELRPSESMSEWKKAL